jgi:hypothetical protein
MHQRDLEQLQENLVFNRVITDDNDTLQITLENIGPRTSHIVYIGVFDKQVTPEIQTYYEVNFYIDASERYTYNSQSIFLEEGGEFEVQIVTEAGNTFSTTVRPGFEVFSDILISIKSTGVWYEDNFPSTVIVDNGTYFSGTVPESIQQVDNNYFQVIGEPTQGTTTSYNPTNFTLGGSTPFFSGSLADLTVDDGQRMHLGSYYANTSYSYSPSIATSLASSKIFNGNLSDLENNDSSYLSLSSYVTQTSITTPSNAIVGYRSNSGNGENYPKSRAYDGSWSSEVELDDSGNKVLYVRVVYSTIMERYNEHIVATLSDDGSLDAYVFNGTSWLHTSFGNMKNMDKRPFDIAYEGTSGEAVIVYANDIQDNTKDLSYRIWNGTVWSNEYYINDLSNNNDDCEYTWINLVTNPLNGSNEIGLVGIDRGENDAHAIIWTGSDWINWQEITGLVSDRDRECVALTYEYSSGNLMAVAGQGSQIVWSSYSVGSWGTPSFFDINPGSSDDMRWLSLKSHKVTGSNRIMLLSLDRATDACANDWDGTSWGTARRLDGRLETNNRRCFDGDWEPFGEKFLAVAGDSGRDYLSYKTWTPSGGWDPSNVNNWYSYTGLTTDQRWIQVRADQRGVGNAVILIGSLDDGRDLVITTWDGTTMTDQIEVTSDMGTDTTEAYDIVFQLFGDPTEYTGAMEFSGSSNLYDPNEIRWELDTSYSTGSVNVTLQLFNYSIGSYQSGGAGYINYVSNTTSGVDENQIQTLTSNLNDFININGIWKIKITGKKATNSSFTINLDLVEIKLKTLLQFSEIEFSGSSNTNAWNNLVWTLDSQWNIMNVDVTVQLYDFMQNMYPLSGDGYVNYVSSSIPNTDEMISINISSAPWRFRDFDGSWKMKLRGLTQSIQNLQVWVDYIDFSSTSGADLVTTEFTFEGITTDSPLGLKLIIVGDHTSSDVGVTVSYWNYATSSYSTCGQGYAIYTSTSANETYQVNITQGAQSFVTNGECRIKINSIYSSTFIQRLNEIQLLYKAVPSGLPANSTGTYLVEVTDEITGEPRPYISLIIFSNGETVEFIGEPNPMMVFADDGGKYEINLKSSTPGGESFKLFVLIGEVSAEKTIIQLP